MSDTRKTTKPNVPNLRFPGFSGEWERVTIGQICNIVGGGTPDTNIKEYWNGGIQWFTPSEVGKEKYVSDSIRTISIDGLKNSSAKLLPPYSILLSSRATVGECSINLRECCTNQGFQSAVPKVDITSTEFLYYRLLTHKREFIKKACGSTFLEISAKQISKLNTFIPARSEQEKIADLLSLIDERISIQNKVIEKYESLIKALYEQLIPGDRDDHAALGTLVRICKGKQLNGEFLSEDGKYYVMNGGITPSGYYDDYNTPAGTISISEGGNSCGFVQYNEKPFWSGGHCYTLLQTTDERVQYKFLYHLLKSKQDDIMALRIGSGLPNIQKKDIGRFPIPMLPLEHQKAITRLLDSVYKHIEYEQALLAELVHLKSFFLGALFI